MSASPLTILSLAELHADATTADARFTAELIRVYGRNAGDARYLRAHADPAVQQAGEAFRVAADAWRNAVTVAR